jgi:outer membrane protein assembly factor BamB
MTDLALADLPVTGRCPLTVREATPWRPDHRGTEDDGMNRLRSMRRAVGVLVSASALLLGSLSPAAAQPAGTPWPMFQHDARHTGQSEWLGPLFPLGAPAGADVRSWPSFGTITSSPTVAADGTVYIGVDVPRPGTSALGYLCAINPDMTEKWCVRTRASASRSSAAIAADGTVYIGDRDNTLTAFDPANGDKLCLYNHGFEGDIQTSPTIGANGTIYFAFSQNLYGIGVFTALNPDCTLKWYYAAGSYIGTSSPAIDQSGFLYVGDLNGRLHKFQDHGTFTTRLWKVKIGNKITASPVIGPDGTVYVGATNGLSAVRPTDGSILWNIPAGIVDQTPALGEDGTVYFAAKSGQSRVIYAVAGDGTWRWQHGPVPLSSPHGGFPTVGADGIVYVGFGTGIHAFSPDGVSLWTHDTGEVVSSFPAIAGTASKTTGGTASLYVATANRTLYAISGPRHGTDSNDPPTADAGPDRTALVGQVVQFNASASDPNRDLLSSTWDFGDGSSAVGLTGHHAYLAAGTYLVSLTVSDGLSSASDTLTVTVSSSSGPNALSDDFNRADSPALGNGWQEARGDLVIQSGEVRNAALKNNHIAIQPGLGGLSHAAAASFASVDNSTGPRLGIVLRFQDPQNYYLLYRQAGGASVLRISRVTSGIEKVLASTSIPNPTVNTLFRLSAAATGDSLTLRLCSASDTSTGTTCGSAARTITATDATLSGGSVGVLLGTGSGSKQHRMDTFAGLVQ